MSQAPDPAENAAMFARIARRYDVANDVLSLGLHRAWRRRLIDAVDVNAGDRVLDCATGTGAVAFACADKGAVVTGVDACGAMLDEARARVRGGVSFVEGDVLDLAGADGEFDVVTIAWGVRNLADPRRGLAEMTRVLKKGGRLGVLEFGQPGGLAGALYGVYGRQVLPRLGGVITGDVDAYAWLNRSTSRFPCGEAFARWLRPLCAAVSVTRLFGGLAWLYRGVR
jgi:demethylmenaquinone methyltransferase/2-methoxy-6-polyprenyl-1,4-benzoquinol methylase